MPNKKIFFLVLVSLMLEVNAIRFPKLPAPKITSQEIYTSPNTLVNIEGQGFIKNLPQVHMLRFTNTQNNSSFRGRIISSSPSTLILQTPSRVSFGDYVGKIRLKSRYLQSDFSAETISLKLRPPAPQIPKQNFQVASSLEEIPKLFENQNGLEIVSSGDLKPGLNTVQFKYTVNGFTSLASNGINFFYLPSHITKPRLEIASREPLRAYGLDSNGFKYDVSSITQTQIETPLISHYFLISPSINHYLMTSINLEPITISAVKATTPEYVIIKNIDNKNYNLSECTLADDLKSRYLFTKDFILQAGSEFKIEGVLSLNDDGDSVTITCPNLTIEKFNYKNLDNLGFGIRVTP